MNAVRTLCLFSFCLATQASDLFDAARRDDVNAARDLLRAGANASERDPKGYTPLILAAYNGSPEVVKLLIKNHADVNAQNAMGSALMGAAFKGEIAIVQLLLDAGARVTDANQSGGHGFDVRRVVGPDRRGPAAA